MINNMIGRAESVYKDEYTREKKRNEYIARLEDILHNSKLTTMTEVLILAALLQAYES